MKPYSPFYHLKYNPLSPYYVGKLYNTTEKANDAESVKISDRETCLAISITLVLALGVAAICIIALRD